MAVWLLRRNEPDRVRPYRAPRVDPPGRAAAAIWLAATVLGFEQFGLTIVIFGFVFAFSGRRPMLGGFTDRRRVRRRALRRSIHVKLTGAMLAVLALDASAT